MIKHIFHSMFHTVMWLFIWVTIGNALTAPENTSGLNFVLGVLAYICAGITLSNIDDKVKKIDDL